MSADEVARKISDGCMKCGEFTLLEERLEDCDPRALDVRIGSLDDHVSMQPAAIAYFGSMLKDAERNVVMLKHGYDRWMKQKYAVAKAALTSGGGKGTVADIEAKIVTDNEQDIVAKEAEISEAERVRDELETWYEAWRQKSYSMTQHANLVSAEFGTHDNLGSERNNGVEKKRLNFEESKDVVRNIIRKGRSDD
jgi:hypothetical protein